MPELPEVETVVRDLRPLLAGRTICGVRQSKHALRFPWKRDWNSSVIGTRIEAVRRRGKWIVVELSRPYPATVRTDLPAPSAVGPHPPTPSAVGPHPPTPSAVGPHPPTPSAVGPHPPTPSAAGPHPPTPSAVGPHPPTPSAVGPHPPTPSAVGPHPPTPSAVGPHPPTPSPGGRGGANHSHRSLRVRGLGGEGGLVKSGNEQLRGDVDPVNPRLIIHLGMTGQFTVAPASLEQPDHLHLVFELDNDRELRFRDVRRFGSAHCFPDDGAVEAFFIENGLGPEPFGIDVAYFRTVLRATSRNLKAILLDQTILAGVGNIYADEACFRARLHPGRKGQTLSLQECDRLREAVEAVLIKAIESRGSTIRDYIGGSGLRGGFQNEFAVYGRTGEPCTICEKSIMCVRLAGRSSHFCNKCQGQGARGKGQEKKRPSHRSRASPP